MQPQEMEKQILEMWREILDNPSITMEDNFFDVGGNSLYAMQMMDEIESAFHLELSVADLLDCRNVREVSHMIAAQIAEQGAAV